MWRILEFLQIWQNFRFLHICCVKNLKFLYSLHMEIFQISPHLSCIEIWNFLHMTDFSPPIYRWSRWQIWGMLQYLCSGPPLVSEGFRARAQSCSRLMGSSPSAGPQATPVWSCCSQKLLWFLIIYTSKLVGFGLSEQMETWFFDLLLPHDRACRANLVSFDNNCQHVEQWCSFRILLVFCLYVG